MALIGVTYVIIAFMLIKVKTADNPERFRLSNLVTAK
jgi:hypothetical protein